MQVKGVVEKRINGTFRQFAKVYNSGTTSGLTPGARSIFVARFLTNALHDSDSPALISSALKFE
jgi:hypothetical protein